MLLQPQPLAEHFLHGLAHGVVLAAGDGLDLGPGGPEPLLQGVGRIQHPGQGPLPAAAAPALPEGQAQGEGGGDQEGDGEGQGRASGRRKPKSAVARTGRQIPRRGKDLGLTRGRSGPNIPRLMSAESPETSPESRVPEVLDAWRMVAARRAFEGVLPLSSMSRLGAALCDTEGQVRFAIEFDRDALQVPYVELRIEAALPLTCQRSLQRFLEPVQLVQRLGLIRDEAGEAALPPGYEALLVPEDGMLRPAELVEDELILAVPVVPVAPGSEAVEQEWTPPPEEEAKANPFSALADWKKN